MNGNPYAIPPQAPVPPMPPKNEKKKSKVLPTVIIIIIISAVVLIPLLLLGLGFGGFALYNIYSNIKAPQKVVSQNNSIAEIVEHDKTGIVDYDIASNYPDVDFPDGMLAKYAPLYAQNNDLRGWIEIPALGMNLPVVQSDDNNYYIDKDFYGNKTSYGVPFFDFRMVDFKNLHMNNVIYGHNMRSDDLIFGILENYRHVDGYKQAPVIKCDTIYGEYNWFVYGVFISNSTPAHDNGYYFPYNFTDIPESEFAQYIEEIDKRKLYDTGVDINTSDKILTLSTACYDFENARLVVVARLQRDGESVSVDTSKARVNENPKYPQKWYDVNKKANPYAEDPRW